MQPNEVGSQKDLILYRIENAKEDLKSAKILRDAGSYKGANNKVDEVSVKKLTRNNPTMKQKFEDLKSQKEQ